MGVTLRVLALLSVAAAAGAEGGRKARSPDPQVPGAFVPRPVHIYGPDGGQQVEPHREVLFSYRINPFETEVYQRGQAPVRYPQSPANQRHTASYSQQQPQFFHSPGQQPLVYHPNFIPQPQYQPLSNNYLGQFYQFNVLDTNRSHQTFPKVQPQNYFADHRSAPEFQSAPNHYGHHQHPGAPDSFFRSSDHDSGFDRGHVESHPLETQVQTFSNFRQAAYPEDSDSSPFSRAAVEAVPITAQVYTGLQVENSSPSGQQRNVDDDSGTFSRGDVESYPAVLMPYTADRDSYEEQVRTEGDGYGSYGQAGFRQAVESPPIFTPLTDPSEAFPMPVHSNSRLWGHLSEKVLYDDPRAIGHFIPTPDVYSFYNPRMNSVRISEGYKVVCYYESWAIYRPQPLDFTVGDIDPHACTHLIYAFAGLDESNYTIMSLDNDYDIVTGGYKALVGLKAQNPLLKVMIGLGGWNEGGRKYSRMVSSPETRQKFIKSVIKFLDEHHFDGLDFDWEYPGASDRGGRYTDKENFAQLIKELSAEFKMRGWVLSAAVSPARFRVNEGYDVPSLGQHLDFISVITYDLRGPWDGMADHHAPIRTRESDSWAYKSLNALDGLRYWAEKGAPKHKLVLGVPFYARTFTLSDPDNYDPGARATSGGIEGRYTMDRGLYAYYEVCQDQRNGGWLMLRDEVGGPYMVKKDQWIGYDDVDYINLKMDMIRNEGFGGAMVWAIDLDDYLGMCGVRWPLLTAVRRRLADGSPPIDDVTFPSEPEPSPETDPEAKPDPDAKPSEGSKPGSEPDSAETQSESDSQSTSSTSSPPKTDSSEELGSEDADRLIRIGSDQSALHERDFACPAPGIHRLADDCSAYYVCNRRFEATKFVCPISLQFDLSRRICNRAQYVRCGAGFTPVSRRDCAADGLYNNPSDCTMYAWCRGGVATHFTCPLGMHFDYLRGVCAEPEEASCNNHEMVRALFDNTTFSLKRPSFRQSRGPHKVVCYFPNWALNRPDEGMFVPENIDPSLCSHIVYAFATIDASTLLLHPYDIAVDISRKFYERVIALKQRQPSVKVMISVGGWADSASDKYSRLVNNPRARKDFVDFSVRMLKAFGFDGLDLHWLYPTCPQMRCSGGNLSDKQGFSALVTELRSAFNRESPALLLSATVAAARGIISRAYDARTLNANLDFVNVLTFDFHTHREGKTGHVSPLYQRPDDEYESQNSAFALEFWVRLGVARSKINLGIPFYGQTFQLANPGQSSLYAPVIGPGDAGPITLQRGMLSYMEMCQRVRDRGWQIARDPSGAIGPFAHRGDQWVSYDDPISVSYKANYVKSEGFGGVMAWSIDFDDFSNKCCREPMPLLRTLARELLDIPLPPPRPGGDCTAPPRPVTPPPPVTTTTYSSGKLTRPTPIDWLPGDDGGKPAATRPTSRPPTTTRATTRWTTSSTTPRTSTWWWTPPPQATTTTTRRTTTSTTTPRPTTTTLRTTTWWWKPPTSTTRRTTTRRTTTVRTTTQRTTTRRPRPTTTPPSRPPSGAGPSEGDACDSEEYHPVSGTCNKFLRCIQGSLKSFKCAPRLHWNQKNKLCDWPSTAGCSSASTTTVERTTTSTTTSRPQPPPWFTTTRRSTTLTSRTTQPPIRTTTWWWRPPVTSTLRPAITTTTRPIVTTTRRPSASPGAPQFGPCEAGTKRPHPTDCGLFLDCTSAREWTERRCAPGLEWDRQQNLCNWPQLAGCSVATRETDAPTPSTTTTPPPPPPPTTPSTTDATQASLTTASSSCTTEGSYMHDPTDCSSYYLCVHGEYSRFTCQRPLQWNRQKKICDWPKNVDCQETGGATGPAKPPQPPAEGDSMVVSSPSPAPPPPPAVELEPVAGQGQLSGDYMVVCYFTNWAWYRPGIGKYTPDDIDPSICTHIVYGFAVLDYSNLVIKPHDSWADLDNNFYLKVTALKKRGIKVTVAIGGWNDSAGDKYSRLVNNPSARRKFTDHVIDFITKYDFDGLDLDWEYPKCWQVDCKKGPDSDKQAFADWVRELSEAFKPRGLLLSAAVSPSKKVIDAGYDVPTLNRYLDWIAVMTYDYHGQWDKKTGHVAPMYYHPEDDIDYFNMDFTIRYWLDQGATPDKIVLGMPMYGQSFTLNDPSVNGLNAPARTGGTAGEFTRAKGFLAYYEICDRVRNKGWTVVKDPEHRMGPYAYSDNQWVSYDDVDTIRRKSQYIREKGLAGGMIWALDLDDFRNRCGQGAHPLMNTIKSVLGSPRSASSFPAGAGAPRPAIPSPSVTQPPPEPAMPVLPEVEEPTAVGSPSMPPSTDDGGYKVVCYFTNWAWYRQGEGKYTPEDIDSSLCTHIVYGFAVLDNSKLLIKPHDTWADFDNKFYEKVTSHKSKGVKVLIAIGGWNDSLGSKYSKLVNNPSSRRRFTEHVVEFILKHNFDGLDLDWEYPKCWQVDCKKGPASDKQAFSAWIMELHEAFKPHGLLLSAAVSPSNKVIDAGYEIPMLSRYLDWIAVMTYDYHGQWDKKTGHVAPMYVHPDTTNEFFNTNFTIHYWIQGGADRKKIVMGMPMYGQSFTLSQASDNTLNQKTYGGGEAGPHTRARGFLAYYEICYFIKNQGWVVVRDPLGTMGPYAYRGNQWVGFDDVGVIRYKSEYIKKMGLGGGMIWALDLDDFRDRCGCEKHPLLRTINRVLRDYSVPDPNCPALGGGPPSELRPFGSPPLALTPTTTTTTTLPPWMTTRKTTAWTPWSASTTESTTSTTRKFTPPPWMTSVRRTTEQTTREPFQPPAQTTEPPRSSIGTGSLAQQECEIGEYRAHESDCNKFYQCNQGKFEERKCFPKLHWAKTRCDFPEKAKCDPSALPPPPAGRPPTPPPSPDRPATTPPPRPSTPPPSADTPSTWRPPPQTTAVAIPSTQKPIYPPISSDPSGFKVVCYFTNWAWYRQGLGKYKPEDIDASLCTHIVYGFAVLDGTRLLIKPHDTWADYDNAFYKKVTDLKSKGVKVLIAIGGWNDSAGDKYSRLVNSPESRRKFTEHVIEFILKHNFDGLDLDWEYPKCWQVECKKGPDSDKPAFSDWIRELHDAFRPHNLLLSAAVSPSYKVIDAGYEVPALNRYLDWIAVMTYDYHGHWDKKTGHVAPMFHHPESLVPEFNANYTIHYWMAHGADRKKLVMGMPMYGQSFALASSSENGLNAKSYGRGEAGEFTRAGGFLAYYEICDRILNRGYTVVRDPQGTIGPYAYKGGQWFGFDDISMIRYKSQYVKDMGLGGAMIWALDLDDFRNRCGCEEHPLLRTINRVLRDYPIPDPGCTL